MNEFKTCSICKKSKAITEFYSNKAKKSGLCSDCKVCDDARHKYQSTKKKAEKMTELVHTKQLADDFGIAEALAASYLATAKLSVHKLLVGKDTLSLFDKVTATKAITDRVKQEAEIQAANLARMEAAKIPTLKDVVLLIKTLSADISDVAELSNNVKKLADQNVIMFKVLTDMKSDIQAKFIDLRAITTGQQQSTVTTPVSVQIREPLPSVSQLKIGIVGLHSGDHATLKKEFGDLFRLSILTPDESRKISGYKGMDKTYLMTKYVSHKHMDLLKAAGQTPVIIPGTVNELKEALTALYLQ